MVNCTSVNKFAQICINSYLIYDLIIAIKCINLIKICEQCNNNNNNNTYYHNNLNLQAIIKQHKIGYTNIFNCINKSYEFDTI